MCLRQISRTTNETQRAATEVMITTPALAEPSERRRARRRAAVTCVMRTAMARPTSTVALATTRHTTRREVTGGGGDDERRDGRTEVQRACLHAHARFLSLCEFNSARFFLLRRRWRGFSRRLSLDRASGRRKKNHRSVESTTEGRAAGCARV